MQSHIFGVKAAKEKMHPKIITSSNIYIKNGWKSTLLTQTQSNNQKRIRNIKSFNKITNALSPKPIGKGEIYTKIKSISPDSITSDSMNKSLSFYKTNNEEQKKILSNLKTTLYKKKEKDNKILLQNEVNKHRQKSLNSSHIINISNKKGVKHKIERNVISINNLSNKVNNLIEMVYNVTMLMNHLQELLRMKNVPIFDIKNEYRIILTKLVDLMKDTIDNKNKINKFLEETNKDEPLNSYLHQNKSILNNISIIDNIKNEGYSNLQLSPSNEYQIRNINDNSLNITESTVNMGSFIKDTSHFEEDNDNLYLNSIQETLEGNNNSDNNSEINNNNNNLKENITKIQNNIFTFRDENIQISQKESMRNNNEYYDKTTIQKILQENKNLKTELASKMLCSNYSKDEIEKLKIELSNAQNKINELTSINSINYISNQSHNNIDNNTLQKELNKLRNQFETELQKTKDAIDQKEKEIKELKEIKSSIEDNLFIKLKENYKNNIVNIKQTFESLVNDKNKKINELNRELIALNEEINSTKAKLSSVENNNRIQNMIKEATLSDLENKKFALELALENLKNDLSNAEISHREEIQTTRMEINEDLSQKNKKLICTINLLNKQIKELNNLLSTKDNMITSLQIKSKESLSLMEKQVSEYSNVIKKLNEEAKSKEEKNKIFEREMNEMNQKKEENLKNYQAKIKELNEVIKQLKIQMSLNKNKNDMHSYDKHIGDKKVHKYKIESSGLEYIVISNKKDKENKKHQKEILDLKSQISSNDETSISNRTEKQNFNLQLQQELGSMSRQSTEKEMSSNRQYYKQKEELSILKAKLRATLDENKLFVIKVNEMKDEFKREREEYINVLRSAFKNFICETILNSKNREFSTIVLKLLNYNDGDIRDIYNTIAKKKGNGMFGFFKK